MFAVFKKHRILKVVGIAFGLFLLWYIASPMIDLIQGQSVEHIDLLGSYVYGTEHYVDIITEKLGKMVSENTTIEFAYTYDKGLLTCYEVIDETNSWDMRVIGQDAIFNCYDSTYLFRKE